MLITCPAPAAPKMGVFSSRLAPNAASLEPEVYIHTGINGQILPRCCLHSDSSLPTTPPHHSPTSIMKKKNPIQWQWIHRTEERVVEDRKSLFVA